MKDYLKCLLQLILSPRNGWEDIEKGDVSPSRLAVDGFLPLIAITAVSVFVPASRGVPHSVHRYDYHICGILHLIFLRNIHSVDIHGADGRWRI